VAAAQQHSDLQHLVEVLEQCGLESLVQFLDLLLVRVGIGVVLLRRLAHLLHLVENLVKSQHYLVADVDCVARHRPRHADEEVNEGLEVLSDKVHVACEQRILRAVDKILDSVE
jgi:hypothetical protein